MSGTIATAEAMSLSLVVYMGVAAAPLIEAGVLAGGLAPHRFRPEATPAGASSDRHRITLP